MDPHLVPAFPRRALAAALALVLLALPFAAGAAEGPAWHGRHPVRWTFARVAAAPTGAAVRVARDPETGLLGPVTAAQAERFALALARPEGAEPLHVVQLPDGSLMIDLRERFMADYRVVRGADGRLRVECTDDPRERARALAESDAPAAWPER